MTNRPSGYMNRKVPQYVEDAIAQHSSENIKTIVKSAIQRYIESFFSKSGGNRKLFENLASEGLKYITDKSVDGSSDSDIRRLQLARLFHELRQELPAIIISDSSFEVIPTNWTGVDAVFGDESHVYSRISLMRELGIGIVVGTRDVSSTDLLHSLLSTLFSEFRFKAGGNLITGNQENGENWVLTLCPPRMGTVTRQMVENDPKDSVYLFTMELPNVMFEDHILLKEPRPETPFLNEDVANPEGGLANVKPEIIMPDTIRINEKVPVHFRLFQERFHTFRVSDPNICTYNPKEFTLSPRKLGEFDLQVMRSTKNINNHSGSTLEVVTSKRIKVIP